MLSIFGESKGEVPKKSGTGPPNQSKLVVRRPLKVVAWKGRKAVKLKQTMKGRRGGSGLLPLSKQIAIFEVIHSKLRFKNPSAALASATTGLITINDVFGAILVVGKVTNTSVIPVATSFRLRKVTIWLAGGGSAEADASIEYFSANSDQEPDMEYMNTIQAGTALCQAVSRRPPKNSTAGFWYRDTMSPVNTAVLGLKISNANSVVELDVDWTLPTAIISSTTITVATATVGAFYRLALNKTNGSSTLVPYDYNTTT